MKVLVAGADRYIGATMAPYLAARGQGQIGNVGADDQNDQIREIAEIVQEVFSACAISFGKRSADNRSDRVSFARTRDVFTRLLMRVVRQNAAFDEIAYEGEPLLQVAG